jgi:Flp pilus assembly protein TadG
MRPTRRSAGQRGAMLLELAMLLPLLILILMLVLEGSLVVRTNVVLNNAAREGARLSIVQENQGDARIADIKATVVAYAAQNHVTIANADVDVNQAVSIAMPTGYGALTASRVTITSTYTMHYLAVFAWLGVPSTYTLQGSAQFQNFY